MVTAPTKPLEPETLPPDEPPPTQADAEAKGIPRLRTREVYEADWASAASGVPCRLESQVLRSGAHRTMLAAQLWPIEVDRATIFD